MSIEERRISDPQQSLRALHRLVNDREIPHRARQMLQVAIIHFKYVLDENNLLREELGIGEDVTLSDFIEKLKDD